MDLANRSATYQNVMHHKHLAYSNTLGKELDELLNITDALSDDLDKTLDIGNKVNDQTWRRHLVRASWSLCEGYIYGNKSFLKKACVLGGVELSEKEIKLLDEGVYIVSIDGMAQWVNSYESTITNIKKTFKLSCAIFDIAWTPDFNDNGWNKLQTSIALRHRIVHPKSVSSLNITDNEIETHMDAIHWFIKTWVDYLGALHEKYA